MDSEVRRFKRNTLCAGLLAIFAVSAHALQPLVTDDTGTQGAGANQIEFSWNEERARTNGETERTSSSPVVYTRGVTETVDLYFGLAPQRIRSSSATASGMGNTAIGAKWRFFENEESGTSLAVKPEVLLPVSSTRENDGLGAGKTSGHLTFILSQDVPFGAVHLNAGVGRERFKDRESNPDATIWRVSVAPVWEVSEQWKLAFDTGVESAEAGGDRVRTAFVEFGAIYSPSKDVDLALGVIRSRDNDAPKTRVDVVNAGLTWRF